MLYAAYPIKRRVRITEKSMPKKVAVQFLAEVEDANLLKDAAKERRQSLASFAYYSAVEKARNVLAARPQEKKARK